MINAITIFLFLFQAIQPPVIAIENVSVIPMDRETVVTNQTVILKDGIIFEIGNTGTVQIPQSAQKIDGSGKYLIPGLAEMHAHIPQSQNADYMYEVLFLYKANGITTVRGMLGHPVHLELREKAAKGLIQSPRIFTSGPSINGNSAPDAETARGMVIEQFEAGYDLLKLHPGITRETYDAIVESANTVGITYAGHVSDFVGLERALEAQQKSVDHLDGYIPLLIPVEKRVGMPILFFGFNLIPHVDENLIPEVVRKTKEANVWNVPTQSLIEHLLGPYPIEELAARDEMKYVSRTQLDQWKQAKQNFQNHSSFTPEIGNEFIRIRRQLIGEMHQQGSDLLMGSDAPQIFNVPGFAIHHEIRMLHESGLSPFEVLQTGTVNVARYFNEEDRAGTIEKGKRADVVLLSGNPFENLENLKSVEIVISGGYLLSKNEIESQLNDIAKKYAITD